GTVRAAVPGRLRVRGPGPDPRLVLLTAGRVHPAVRPSAVPERPVPGPDSGRAGAQDVQVAGQHGRALGGARPLWRRRLPLVLLHLKAALGRLPVLVADDRGGGTPVPASAVAHLRVLRAV